MKFIPPVGVSPDLFPFAGNGITPPGIFIFYIFNQILPFAICFYKSPMGNIESALSA